MSSSTIPANDPDAVASCRSHPKPRKCNLYQGGAESTATAATVATASSKTSDNGDVRFRKRNNTFDDLHREMEVAEYATVHGQKKRRAPRNVSLVRTRKRKVLERLDDMERMVAAGDEEGGVKKGKRGRMRGSKAAFESDVVEERVSLFGASKSAGEGDGEDDDKEYKPFDDHSDNKNEGLGTVGAEKERGKAKTRADGVPDLGEGGRYEMFGDGEGFGRNSDEGGEGSDSAGHDADEEGYNDSQDCDDDEGGESQDQVDLANGKKTAIKTANFFEPRDRRNPLSSTKQIGRFMYRLKNFKSHRVAQRHGDALGAHARGMQLTAVKKLGEVAEGAPIAPQVYSSLGLLYENMLMETEGGIVNRKQKRLDDDNEDDEDKEEEMTTSETLESMTKRLALAERAYGSFHIAALLCKKDYTLWTRSGDSAMEIVHLHEMAMTTILPDTVSVSDAGLSSTNEGKQTEKAAPTSQIEHHRSQKRRWLLEAKAHYTAADNLRPPGITVPAKLAAVQMELGNLSEALTILTDLKNSADRDAKKRSRVSFGSGGGNRGGRKSFGRKRQRSEMERSPSAWLLYSDLMLRVGHECNQWNRGASIVDNYMFKRWLRKYSESFNWRERRLQSLCMALESASGSESCKSLREWMRNRELEKARRAERKENRWNVVDENRTGGAIRSAEAGKGVVTGCADEDEGDGTKDSIGFGELLPRAGEDGGEEFIEKATGAPENLKEAPAAVMEEDGRESNAVGTNTDKNDVAIIPASNDEALLLSSISNCHHTMNGIPCTNHVKAASVSVPPSSSIKTGTNESLGSFERERQDLLIKNRSQLDSFDQETSRMGLRPGSRTGKARREEREALVKRQRAAVVSFVGGYHQRKVQSTACSVGEGTGGDEVVDDGNAAPPAPAPPPLPMSASCAQVCSIASQLMKHCLGLELYECGRLVGESVSAYLKARATRQERRVASRDIDRAKHLFRSGGGGTGDEGVQLCMEKYDEIKDETEYDELTDEEDLDAVILSDDDDMDAASSTSPLLLSMKRGVLPTELQVLYGLCLVGEGGKNYAARKSLELIQSLPDDDIDGGGGQRTSSSEVIDKGVNPDPAWVIFESATTGPLHRTAAFAFVSDLLQKMKKEREWSAELMIPFRNHVKNLQDNGCLVALMGQSDTDNGDGQWYCSSATEALKRGQRLRIVMAALRMRMNIVDDEFSAAASVLAQGDGAEDDNGSLDAAAANSARKKIAVAARKALSALDTVIQFHHALWSEVGSNGAMKPASIEVLKIFSSVTSIVARCVDQLISSPEKTSLVSTLFSQLRHIVSYMCGVNVPPVGEMDTPARGDRMSKWVEFPIPANWQSHLQRSISLRAYNLCIGCAVSLFSGWDNREFTMDLLEKRGGPSYFGVNVHGMQVAGYLGSEAEHRLSDQWQEVAEFIPWMSSFDLESNLSDAKDADWYVSAMNKRSSFEGKLPTYGEDYGVTILLNFSKTCLLLAHDETNESREVLVTTALSVMLPMTQFCANTTLWLSRIGTAAITQEGIIEWEQFFNARDATSSHTPEPSRKQTPPNQLQKTSSSKNIRKKLPRSPLSNLVKVPAALLLQEWTAQQDDAVNKQSQHSRLVMKRLDFALKQLRSCFTVNAFQKASLSVASSLLDVASTKECHNPFLCLQQAAMFACQGPKRGSSDGVFKKPLPLETECSPEEALDILGRADCMRAVHFTEEASFLCSFVARVCCQHRDRERLDMPWNSKWRAIGIQTYIVSAAIDAMAVSAIKGDGSGIEAPVSWETAVKEEIGRGRSDAIAFVRNFNRAPKDRKRDSQQSQKEENGVACAKQWNTSSSRNGDVACGDGVSDNAAYENIQFGSDGNDEKAHQQGCTFASEPNYAEDALNSYLNSIETAYDPEEESDDGLVVAV